MMTTFTRLPWCLQTDDRDVKQSTFKRVAQASRDILNYITRVHKQTYLYIKGIQKI